jgi:hypothetical protein
MKLAESHVLSRLLLAALLLVSASSRVRGASPIIVSEFMARNTHSLADEDGTFADWIEVHNITVGSVNLNGWYLTDTTNNLAKWRFPSTNILANGYLVVFASGKNRLVPGAPLHTSFQLDGDGEYLALVMPDAVTVATEFAPTFPHQVDDISYGNRQSVTTLSLVTNGSAARYSIPVDATLGTNWAGLDFNDATWKRGRTGLGYVTNGATAALYSYWPVEEGSGNTVSNVVADASQGLISGATWTQDPVRGTVLSFNGQNAYVSAGTIPRMSQSASNFTWSFWYYQRSVPNNNSVILGNRSGGIQSPLQFIKFTPSNFEYYRDASIGTMPYAVPGGSWRHLAVVKQGAALRYYDNGTQVGSATAGGDIEVNPFYWGGDPGASGEFADGLLDDISLWTTALTGEQIVSLAAGSSPLTLFGVGGEIGTDLKTDMFGVNPSAYARISFTCPDVTGLDILKLRMKYEDGFIAYLNGVEIARRNAPTEAQWNSVALASHGGFAATQFEDIDVSAFLDVLRVGENVLAIHGLNLNAAAQAFLVLPELEGSSISELGDGYFSTPTPGAANDPGFLGFVADVQFDHERGFYSTNFDVALSCSSPDGAVIRYTTDGTAPTLNSGTAYQAPIPVSRTTFLRAAAFSPGYQSSSIGCQSYLFLRDILKQTGAGFPSSWGDSGADYAMDPRVVTNAAYAGTIETDMKSLPVMSIVVDPADFFGPPPRGIYSTPTSQGVNYERACSAEFFFPDASQPGYQINCGLRIAGGASRSPALTPKHGMRLLFKAQYGPSKLDYKFFEDSELQSFDTLQLRPNFNMSWVRTDNSGPLNNGNADGAERTHAIYVRDQFTKDSQRAMGNVSAHERFVHLYINGLYWGIYNPSEHTDAAFAADYYGGDKSEYDAIFSDPSTVARAVDGDKNAWNEMFALANRGLASSASYSQIQQYLDVTNLADYMMLNFYCSTVDWPWQNWNAARKRETNAVFHFFVWDAEYTLETPPWVPADRTDVGGAAGEGDSPAWLYHQLRQNAEWRLLFADRAHEHLFNGGALTTNQTIPRFLALCDQIDRAIVCESARWGDVVRKTQPYTRNLEWVTEKNRLLTQFFAPRSALVIQQFKKAGLYPLLEAPTFTPPGGDFTNSVSVSMSVPVGTVYYTTNGLDPRLAGGAIASTALVFSGPLTLTGSSRILARTLYTNTWSALSEVIFPAAELPPKLDIVSNGSSIILSWPPEITGYQLESATIISSGLWVPVPTSLTNTVILPASGTGGYYRLRKP